MHDPAVSELDIKDENLTVHSRNLIESARQHLWFHSGFSWESVNSPDGIRIMESGQGSSLRDMEGRTILDFASGLWLANVGYGRREIAEAMYEQAGRLQYSRSDWPTESTVVLAARLAELCPGALDVVFFVSGGGEANEAALKMAMQYHQLKGEPSRTKFIGRDLSYHGASFATMSVGGAKLLNRSRFESAFIRDAQLVSPPRLGRSGDELAAELEEAIVKAGPNSVAAFIGEPVSNAAGIIVPDADYWPKIREICDRYGVLLICDEVVTGFGRTGRMFGIEHWDVEPDIMTVAKGITSGYAPLGATIARREVYEAFRPGKAEAFQHVITFGGQSVACAGALACLDIIEREGLVANAVAMGERLAQGLAGLKARHASIINTRGLGLMRAVQMARTTDGSQSFTLDERARLSKALIGRCLARGVNFQGHAERLVFMPPLVVTPAEIDTAVGVLDEALHFVEGEFGWW